MSQIPLKSTIAKYDDSTWRKVGNMKHSRRGHNVIALDQDLIVVGGVGLLQTEKCSFDDDVVNCQSQKPLLSNYMYFPELFLVADDFCLKTYYGE